MTITVYYPIIHNLNAHAQNKLVCLTAAHDNIIKWTPSTQQHHWTLKMSFLSELKTEKHSFVGSQKDWTHSINTAVLIDHWRFIPLWNNFTVHNNIFTHLINPPYMMMLSPLHFPLFHVIRSSLCCEEWYGIWIPLIKW